MLFSLHYALTPHSLLVQKTQNEDRKAMNRNFPMLEYLETIGLKYLIRSSDPLRLTEMHTTSPTDTPLHFCDGLPSGCFL